MSSLEEEHLKLLLFWSSLIRHATRSKKTETYKNKIWVITIIISLCATAHSLNKARSLSLRRWGTAQSFVRPEKEQKFFRILQAELDCFSLNVQVTFGCTVPHLDDRSDGPAVVCEVKITLTFNETCAFLNLHIYPQHIFVLPVLTFSVANSQDNSNKNEEYTHNDYNNNDRCFYRFFRGAAGIFILLNTVIICQSKHWLHSSIASK